MEVHECSKRSLVIYGKLIAILNKMEIDFRVSMKNNLWSRFLITIEEGLREEQEEQMIKYFAISKENPYWFNILPGLPIEETIKQAKKDLG